MELHHSSRLTSAIALQRCEQYLSRLPLTDEQRRELLARASSREGADAHRVLTEVHKALAGRQIQPGSQAFASLLERLKLALDDVPEEQVAMDVQGRARLATMPSLLRTSMVPRRWPSGLLWRVSDRLLSRFTWYVARRNIEASLKPAAREPKAGWPAIGSLRRVVLLMLIVLQTSLATDFMADVLPYGGRQPLEVAILILFAILFAWVSAGFWTAMAGFLQLMRRVDRYAINRGVPADEPIDPSARTAIVMPICNEDVVRVFAGLRATYESLERTGKLQHFDFYVLSDSGDPDLRVAETSAWLQLCRDAGAFGRVFYRWRQHHIKRKSGNIADFCRRWGNKYRYMVVLDADSVMSGDCLARLVQLMEANPNAGIIQTTPLATGRDTLYARIQQFATRVYGPIFTAGLHFWQLGESHYWGHNAIIRVAPFIRHCALARLPGTGSLSGEILSHDFVEAALMRRAGWSVWLAYDLPGSYEEMPPSLVDELKRDQRWCHGNLMNFRLFFLNGLHPAHRAVFMIGVMAYLSAPLWFASLLLSTALLAVHTLSEPQYFVQPYQLFPLWPEWRPEWALMLGVATATLLITPKIVSVLLVWLKGARHYGGALRVGLSAIGELLTSMLLAPIRMLFHTQFVVTALLGWRVRWKSPPREDAETGWGEALRRHGWQTLLGIAWASGVYWLNPAFLWWLLPVVGALMLSIPLSVFTSRVSVGRRLRRWKFFLIPEEVVPPVEIRSTAEYARRAGVLPDFIEAVMDPLTNALASASAVARLTQPDAMRAERTRLAHVALIEGPDALNAKQKALLLNDPLSLSRLHFQAWTSDHAHRVWQEARIASPHNQREPAKTALPALPMPAALPGSLAAQRGG